MKTSTQPIQIKSYHGSTVGHYDHYYRYTFNQIPSCDFSLDAVSDNVTHSGLEFWCTADKVRSCCRDLSGPAGDSFCIQVQSACSCRCTNGWLLPELDQVLSQPSLSHLQSIDASRPQARGHVFVKVSSRRRHTYLTTRTCGHMYQLGR